MAKRSLRCLAAGILLVSLSGCALRLADLNAISTRNLNLDRVDLDRLEGQVVEGESSVFVFLFIPFGWPNLQDAVDDALDKGGGDLITDAVVYHKWWTAILFGKQKLTVKGTVVKTRGAGQGGK